MDSSLEKRSSRLSISCLLLGGEAGDTGSALSFLFGVCGNCVVGGAELEWVGGCGGGGEGFGGE